MDAGQIEVARRVKPKLILMDIKMPGKSGLEVAHEIQYLEDLSDIPIVIMSGVVREDRIPFMEVCGIKKYLRKPLNPLDIIWEIEDALKKRSAGS